MGDGTSLGQLLRHHRAAAGLTIEELADRSGVSTRALSNLERDLVRRPQRRTLTAVLDVLAPPAGDRALIEESAGVGRPPPGPCPMPAPPADFTGRVASLGRLTELAGSEEPPAIVAVLTGQPGVGKTALALRAAHDLADRYPDGRFFVDLRGTHEHPATAGEVLQRLLLALGLGASRIPSDVAERARIYRGLLRHRRTLLVLDNAASEEQVRPLLPSDGPALVLLTCRRWLSGLEAVHWLPQEPLSPAESMALLRTVGHIEEAPPERIAALAGHCGHLPLALRIAGQRLRDEPTLTVADLDARLAQARDRVAAIDGGNSGLSAALTLSYRWLSVTGRTTLRRLALIPGPDFGAEAVAVLCAVDLAEAEDRLDGLVESGLLGLRPPDRYGLHDLVRAFAMACLERDEPSAAPTLRENLVTWLLEATVRAGRHFEPGGPAPDDNLDADQARDWLDTERENWFPALRIAAETGRDDLVVAVADALHWFSDQRIYLDIWPEVFRLAAEAATRTGDLTRQATHLNYLSWAQTLCLNDASAGLETARAALRSAQRAGDRAQQGWALLYAASAQLRLREFEAARRLLQRGSRMLRAAGDHEGTAQAMSMLGIALRALGRTSDALRVHRRTLRLLRDAEFPIAAVPRAYSDAIACRWIGLDLTDLGRWGEAVGILREAVAGTRSCGLRTQEMAALIELAEALRRTGCPAEAGEHLAAAVELAGSLGDADSVARARTALAELNSGADGG
ncbi:helix-turn-helix domain-containing protein [Verrucosispora sp. WMMD573]|uniref:ATP-binding protein n=1 Tax=Verrucosispora sp. WMMD573 TaxID=3015149 RepID=UPI00248B578C|nr:helix-turn-helix domain-containing protein [Verrucosispora sp. WMMD573]WBB53666.1 helix-turn-helix domain-containing protein [Verrucosispora sp. WMMD573]